MKASRSRDAPCLEHVKPYPPTKTDNRLASLYGKRQGLKPYKMNIREPLTFMLYAETNLHGFLPLQGLYRMHPTAAEAATECTLSEPTLPS